MNKIKGTKQGMIESYDPKKPNMPTITISLSDIPEAESWEVGQVYPIEFNMKMTGIHKDGKKGYATFEAQEIEVESEEEESEEEDEEDESNEPEEKKPYTRK